MAINFYLIYFGILLLIIIACAFHGKNQKSDNFILVFAIFLIFCFMAFRKDFTPDYGVRGYEGLFNALHSHGISKKLHSEIGYQWLNIILPSYRMVIVITSLLFCSALFFLFRRYILPKYWAFAFLILFVSKSMLLGNISGIRNSIAVSAFIYGFYFLEQNKKIPYLIILFLASFFHMSSLFFIPLVLINSNKISHNKIQLLWVIISLFALVSTFIPNIINSFSIWLFSSVDVFSNYLFYMKDEMAYSFRGISFLLICFMLYSNINVLKNQNLQPKEILLIKLSLPFYLVMLLPGIGLLSRTYFYVSFPQMAGNIYVMQRINDKLLKWAYIFGMIVIPLMELYGLLLAPAFEKHYLHYHSILF